MQTSTYYGQWWASYFVKVTELQLLGKKVTKLQLPFWKSNYLLLQLLLINLIRTSRARVGRLFLLGHFDR